MIQRFSFGHPFPTQSVVLSLPAESGPVPFLTPDGTGWRFTLSEQAAVYGLGEMPRGINKRGWHYITNNTDESRHSEDKLSFYGAHNFLLVRDGSTCFGLFVQLPVRPPRSCSPSGSVPDRMPIWAGCSCGR